MIYLDDVIVFSKDIPNQIARLKEVFSRLRTVNLKLKPKKCEFFQTEVAFLGHIVNENGIQTDPEKISAVKLWPQPRCVKDVRAFLGLTGYYRKFIKDYAVLATPLTELTKKQCRFRWQEQQEEAFTALKEKLTEAPILGYPDPECSFILDTDASGCTIGGVLSQVQDGKEVVISYGSRKLSKSEQNYCVTRRELLAIVWFCEHYRHYLIGRNFKLRTDHGSLTWLFSFKDLEGQLARWIERLGEFQFTIEHRPGRLHGNSDALSRIPCQEDCKFCNRVAQRYVYQEQPEARLVNKVRTRKQASDLDEWQLKISQEQETDPVLGVIKEWKDRPSWEEVARGTPELKYYWSHWDQLKLKIKSSR